MQGTVQVAKLSVGKRKELQELQTICFDLQDSLQATQRRVIS